MADNANYIRQSFQDIGRSLSILFTMNSPNLLILHCDQLSSWALSAYEGDEVQTPHIDRLADEGMRLDQFFTNVALCTPSRACFLTGRYPSQTGIYTGIRELGKDQITFAHPLQDAGYRTGYAGKWHLSGQQEQESNWQTAGGFGFEDIRFQWNKGHFKHIEGEAEHEEPKGERHRIGDEHSYGTDWLAERCMEFIDVESEAPFAYMLSFPDPHQPYKAREPYLSQFPPETVRIPSTFAQEDVPDWIARDRETKDFPVQAENRREWNHDREQTLRDVKRNYCAMVKNMDDAVSRILAKLEQKQLLDKTLVVFTTDHGDLMGEHGMTGKNFLYEPAYRIPMILRLPGVIPAGSRCDDMISMIDMHPTFLDLLGVPQSGTATGVSAAPLIRGESQDWNNIVFTHPYGNERVACFTPEWELGFDFHGEPVLFDRINDPDQTNNLYGNPEHAELIATLRQRMDSHYAEYCPRVTQWLPGQKGFDTPKPEMG